MRHGVTEIEMKDDPTFSTNKYPGKYRLGQIKKYTCLASPPDLRIAPDLNMFFFYIFL